MSEWSWSNVTSLVTPAGTRAFNAASGDTLLIDPSGSTGLGTAEVRTSIFNKGQTDGYNFAAPFLLEGMHLVITAFVRIESASTDAAYAAARDVVLTDLRTKLKSILATEGTLNVGADAYAVRCEHLPDPTTEGITKTAVFGLVCASAP